MVGAGQFSSVDVIAFFAKMMVQKRYVFASIYGDPCDRTFFCFTIRLEVVVLRIAGSSRVVFCEGLVSFQSRGVC